MPQLLFRGIEKENIIRVSKDLVKDLVEIIGCPSDYFTLEHVPTSFVSEGETISGTPLVQINWFDRGPEIRDKVAANVTQHLLKSGCGSVDVYFIDLKAEAYYENGKHF